MSNVESWLLKAARKRVADFAGQLAAVSDTSVRVPNLTWSVAELGQHVAGLAWHFQDLHDAGEGFEQPADWTAWGDGRRAHVTETEAGALANRIEAEFAALFEQLEHGPDPRWFYGFATSPSTVAAMIVNECVMHGRDLAGVTDATPPVLTTREAHAVAHATMISMHVFVDPTKADAQPDGVYHVKFRGGKDYTWTKQGPELLVTEGRPAKADARLNADPAMFMMSSMGRVGQIRAGLSGKVISYGRKPWRFLGLTNVVADGV